MVKICVIDTSMHGVFLYSADEKWSSETIESYLHSQGRNISNCHWSVYDQIIDLKEY